LSEKESLRKSFTLFFLVIELLLGFIFYQYYRIEEEHLQESLLLEMKSYSFSFEGEQFEIEISPYRQDLVPYELYQDAASLYILVPFPDNQEEYLKIYYPRTAYRHSLSGIRWRLIRHFLLLSLVAMLISYWFSRYTLTPLRDSVKLMERFIKDMIHDLNTPLSAILINLKMMDSQNSEVKSIQQSAKAISMLHHNLEAYLRDSQLSYQRFDLRTLIAEQAALFQSLYDTLEWHIHTEMMIVRSDRQVLSRVLYNLLSNACKYNTPHGHITIRTQGSILSISNSSYGIKHPERIFERFYKESERGLGIGLHIVSKLCHELSIPISLQTEGTEVTFILDFTEAQKPI